MAIYVDQVGYINSFNKTAVVTEAGTYCLMKREGDNDICIGEYDASPSCFDDASGDTTAIIDFSSVSDAGKYYFCLKSNTEIRSANFEIGKDVYTNLQKVLCKCLYFQRCGCALDEKHAGVYKHGVCHTGKAIYLQDYLNKTPNPETFEMCGGWHDAGDFGRYSTPAAVALGHLLYAYELYPESFTFDLNIPETGNGIPDILNECRYELDWLIKMQAPDGGVYHKLTAYNHADFIMPEYDKDQFLIYPVSSIAVADFVAIFCVASRVYRAFDPEFADRALEAAKKSFVWLSENDYIGFHNPEGSNTGEYDDECDADERMWAAAEMIRTCESDYDISACKSMLEKYVFSDMEKTDFGWTDVAGFTLLSVLTDSDHKAGASIEAELKAAMLKEADRLLEIAKQSGYRLFMKPEDYVWGSNMVVLNRGMLMVLAASFADNDDAANRYIETAVDSLHYILGRNALNRSYVTGIGEFAYKNPHNRTSACDGIDEPMPGWVSGGPFKTPVDPDAIRMIPKNTPPMKCHADCVGSYSTNEITIYWNSPAVFITAYLNK